MLEAILDVHIRTLLDFLDFSQLANLLMTLASVRSIKHLATETATVFSDLRVDGIQVELQVIVSVLSVIN